jgi:predicted transcriptional regulator
MEVGIAHLEQHSSKWNGTGIQDDAEAGLMLSLRRLAPREREVAAFVFRSGEATANQVVNALSDPLSNSAVRSMLNRLVSKKVLGRARRGKLFLYRPSKPELFQERALKQLADEYFQSSVHQMAISVINLIKVQESELIANIASRSDRADHRDELPRRRRMGLNGRSHEV